MLALGEFSRVGIQDGFVGMSLALLHEVDALCADFHSIDERLGREGVGQAL